MIHHSQRYQLLKFPRYHLPSEQIAELISQLETARFDHGVDTERMETDLMLLEHELGRCDALSRQRLAVILDWLAEDVGNRHSANTLIDQIKELLRNL